MSLNGLPTATMTIPFAAGLNTRGDKRAKNPPNLDIALNVEFDDTGGLRTRYPFSALANATLTGGTLANCRGTATRDGELLVFTDTALYGWDATASKWINRGTHLAVNVDEEIRFASNGDQQAPDRAELSGIVVMGWIESGFVYLAAYDKASGAIIQPATQQNSVTGASRVRVVEAGDKIVALWVKETTFDLMAIAVDCSSAGSAVTSITALSPSTIFTAAAGFNLMFDAVRIPGQNKLALAFRQNPTTSYLIGTLTSGLAGGGSVKARTCVGPIAVSCTPDGASFQIVRDVGNVAGTNRIRGDLVVASTLADTYTDQEIGTYGTLTAEVGSPPTTVNQIAATHRSVQNSGQYRCYAFWSAATNDLGRPATKTNWVDTGNTLGTQSTFQARCDIGSRAFDYNGSVYYWAVFNDRGRTFGAVQGTYLLYRDDGFLTAASRTGNAAYAVSLGSLPGVATSGSSKLFTWAGVFSRRTGVDPTSGFVGPTARAPREITFEFDSNEARRTYQLGHTLYISGSPLLQYDGVQITEVGFLIGPWFATNDPANAVGALPNGVFGYKPTLRWLNAVGEVDRSTSFDSFGWTTAGGGSKVQWTHIPAVWTTRKDGATWELWRTTINPSSDSPFYLVTSNDPAKTNPNAYIANSRTSLLLASLDDNADDLTAAANETNPENGSVLESIAPPSARIIAGNATRLFLGDVAGDPDRVWYSKQRNAGEVASFNDVLVVDVPREGGDITALAFLQETLVVFRESAIYMLPGDGFDNGGGGSNYGPARVISLEVGAVNQESVVLVPDGLLFKCSKGWYLLGRGWDVQYIGAPVYAYDSETPLAAHVMPAQHQVRIVTASRMLVWDYLVNQWGEWTIADGLDATIYNGAHHYLTSTGPKAQQTTYAAVNYGWDVESAWIKINELQGRGLVREIKLLGEYRGAHSVRVRLARNYESDGAGGWSYNYDTTWTVSPTTVGGPEQLRVAPKFKRCQSIKVRLTALATDKTSQPSGETANLTGLSLAVAVEEGLYQGLAAAAKQ